MKKKQNIGLFFGSFNPIHFGHLIIANYMSEFTDLDQIWFVISPHNPLKKKQSLLNVAFRFEMVEIAIKEVVKFKTCNAEINLPQPSYTIHTLAYLSEKYPKYNFSIIMGADNLLSFNKWKNYTQILENYNVYIYPRSTYEKDLIPEYLLKYKEKIFFTNAPIIEISSSFIRSSIAEKKDVRFFLPEGVSEYIDKQQFYK